MSETALFRHIVRGTSYYVTVAKRYIPEGWSRVTVTVVIPDSWKTGRPLYGHLSKELGATIHGSYKIVIDKALLRQLNALDYRKPVWIRATEFTQNPPPPPQKPYIQKPVSIDYDGSSYFFTLSPSTVDLLREIAPGRNLKISVHLGNKVITYVKRPSKIRSSKTSEQIYKVLLPASLFGNLLTPKTVALVRVETTDEEETF